MARWSDIITEIGEEQKVKGAEAFDIIRRKYLVHLSEYTKRDTILYASRWLQGVPKDAPIEFTSIHDSDIQGFMEVVHGLEGDNLDLILHSPGGSIETAEGIVKYLRSKFNHIRVIIPQQAMSAATMISCAADEIVMGKHSFIGPIDPQLILPTPLGWQMAPAQAIVDQFELAQEECVDQSKLASWAPMLQQYGPHLLINCKNLIALSEELVRGWLGDYMFANDTDREEKTNAISQWLIKHEDFKTHSRHLSIEDAVTNGLKITPLEDDQGLQDAILSVYHATTVMFTGTAAAKIIENHKGKAFVQTLVAPQAAPPKPS